MYSQHKRKRPFLTPRRKRALGVFVLYLLGILPGLYVTWTRTPWKKSTKVAVSLLAGLVLLGIVAPMTNPPARQTNGVVLVGSDVETEIYGPEAPANRSAVEVYTPVRTAIVLEATVEPEPIYVYCNNGGKYYHSEECRWVKDTTPKATLTQALDAGYSRCSECDAPDGRGY